MTYDNNTIKKILDDIITNVYRKNPIVLMNIWDGEGEEKYIDFLHLQYEKILIDLNKIFDGRFKNIRVLEISSFLGVVDIALAKIGFEVYTYDIPEFQKNNTLNKLYSEFNVHPSSGYLHDTWKTGLPYPDNHFNAVILSEVIEHLNFNPLPLLQEINRILKKDGIIYITTPNQVNLMNRVNIILGRSIRNSIHDSVTQLDQTKRTICGIHWREYTLKELIQLLEITGFTITMNTYSHMAQKPTSPIFKKAFYVTCGLLCPQLGDSITIIARKKEYKPMKFWFIGEYIKYIKSNY
jgi:2-polyprenyl-3-methyl-5-hydroxy-6-metoxy-1,4-benzoquinol methylase